ncbi:MAG: ABC transporter permease, partial [Chloroflexota bacterium]
MTALLLTRRYLAEYARRPLNLVLLVVVPVIFVVLTASAIADFAKVVGGVADTGGLASATAGWAASFLAGVAGFFLVHDSRGADRRLAGAGMGTPRITAARLASGLVLALLASAAAVLALLLQTGEADPVRA